LHAAIQDPDPVIIMNPKLFYRLFKEEVPDGIETMEIGKAQVIQEGTELTIVSYGASLRVRLKRLKC